MSAGERLGRILGGGLGLAAVLWICGCPLGISAAVGSLLAATIRGIVDWRGLDHEYAESGICPSSLCFAFIMMVYIPFSVGIRTVHSSSHPVGQLAMAWLFVRACIFVIVACILLFISIDITTKVDWEHLNAMQVLQPTFLSQASFDACILRPSMPCLLPCLITQPRVQSSLGHAVGLSYVTLGLRPAMYRTNGLTATVRAAAFASC